MLFKKIIILLLKKIQLITDSQATPLEIFNLYHGLFD